MSLLSKENAVTEQLDPLAAATELSSAERSEVPTNSFSPMKHLDTYPAGREVVFVCTYYGRISFSCIFHSPWHVGGLGMVGIGTRTFP